MSAKTKHGVQINKFVRRLSLTNNSTNKIKPNLSFNLLISTPTGSNLGIFIYLHWCYCSILESFKTIFEPSQSSKKNYWSCTINKRGMEMKGWNSFCETIWHGVVIFTETASKIVIIQFHITFQLVHNEKVCLRRKKKTKLTNMNYWNNNSFSSK